MTLSLASLAEHAYAEDTESLARQTKNPLTDVTNLSIFYDANLNTGADYQAQHVITIQPVIPVSINSQWSLITRTMVPLILQPPQAEGESWTSGAGDIQFSAFLSPTQTGKWVWGIGSAVLMPSASHEALGQGKWAVGPTAAAIRYDGPWTYGTLISNVWSVAGNAGRNAVNQMQLEPLLSYNFPHNPDRSVSFSPTFTADWKASGGERWTLPLGVGLGQLVKLGAQSVGLQATAYYYVAKPTGGPNWTLELQVQFLFPK
jgi:hypothetical protein